MLLNEMVRRCKGMFEILELEVFVGNHPAKRLYEKSGFKTCDQIPSRETGGF